MRRSPGEVARRTDTFRIRTREGRALARGVGEAFIGGFNTMISAPGLAEVSAAGHAVTPHFRPFFFEGAAMGYLPRGWVHAGVSRHDAEAALLSLDPAFRYLYYVGLGFWFAMRRARPDALIRMQPHLDPMHFPLCFDGYGFQIAFYDNGADPATLRRIRGAPAAFLPAVHQGYGRALHFVFMDDPEGFDRFVAAAPPVRRADLECGRALALGFTRCDRPATLIAHLESARDEETLGARLAGLTWALTARHMNDPVYFRTCLSAAPSESRAFLEELPALCHEAFATARSYDGWQEGTREAARDAWRRTAGMPSG